MKSLNNENRTVVWLGLAAFVWSMLFVWQGLDFMDMGYWLTGYQQFYVHPEVGWALCWLTNFFGYWVGTALGGGVLAYKLGYVVVITASAIISYQLLASQFGQSRSLAAMVLLTVCFTRGVCGNWVGYNELTALFYLAGAALLYFGLIGNRKLLVMLAGVVFGANVFIRFPNLLGMSLVAAIWFQAWVYRWSLRDFLVWSFLFLGGFTLGMALIFGLIVLHGHETIYLHAIHATFGEAVGANSPHSGSGLIRHFISDQVNAYAMGLSVLFIGGGIANWVSNQKKLLATFFIVASALVLFYVNYVGGRWIWSVPGICYIALLSIIFLNLRSNTNLALLALIAGIILVVTPLGSANGIVNSVYGMWLALPLTLMSLWKTCGRTFLLRFKAGSNEYEYSGKFAVEESGLRVITLILILSLLLQLLSSAWRHTYLDSNNRFSMTHSIANSHLVGTYTTAERAKVVNELLLAMSRFAKPGDEVLAYNGIPILFFLTDTHPWLGISWPDLESDEKISILIEKKENTKTKLPLIVRATASTYASSWPDSSKLLVSLWYPNDPHRAFADFESRHGYVVVWSNDFFEILAVNKS